MEHSTDPSRTPIRTFRRPDHLGREARDSAAFVLLTLAVVLTVSFVGIALS